MKSKHFFILFLLSSLFTYSQSESFPKSWFKDEPSKKLPYGRLSTSTVAPTNDFDKLIGVCDCKSVSRQADGKWADTLSLKWRWKYIMNGNGVQDEGWFGSKENPSYFTSIRSYDKINKQWYVSYFTPNLSAIPSTWTGRKEGENIVLKRATKTPNGKNATSVLTFFDITHQGFNWEGKIENPEFPNGEYIFWKIFCKKNFKTN